MPEYVNRTKSLLPTPYEFKKMRVNKMLSAIFEGDQNLIEKWWYTGNSDFDHMKPADVFEINQDKVVEKVHAIIRSRM